MKRKILRSCGLVGGAGFGVGQHRAGGGDDDDGSVSLPVTIDFQDETVGQTPSFVTNRPDFPNAVVGTVNGGSVNGFTKELQFAGGDPYSMAFVDLGGNIDPSEDGLRIQVLELLSTQGRRSLHLTKVANEYLDRLHFSSREELSPDTLRVYFEVNDVPQDTGDTSIGTNVNTGGQWTYTRWEFQKTAEKFARTVYDSDGNSLQTEKTIDFPASYVWPTQLRHLRFEAGGGFDLDVAEIWVGTESDPWPSI